MNFHQRLPVPSCVPLLLASLLSALFLVSGCATNRDVNDNREIASGYHNAGSAISSDYLVRSGAQLHADYAFGSRFYVESGGSLTGLGKGARESTAYAEPGAKIARRQAIGLKTVKNARKAYAERDKIVEQPLGPGLVTGGGGPIHRHDDDDDEDDDDDDDRPRYRNRGSVSISGSSYQKKDKD